MSPKKKAVIITSMAAAGLVAIVLIVACQRQRFAGTPIIIKGGSTAQPVEITGEIPSTKDKEHVVDGKYTSIIVTGNMGKCMIYKFDDDDHFSISLKTEPDVEEVYVDERGFDYVGIKFDEKDRFTYSGSKFTSNSPLKVTSLSIDVPSASCTDEAGSSPTCPTKFPNGSWSDLGNLIVTLGNTHVCPVGANKP